MLAVIANIANLMHRFPPRIATWHYRIPSSYLHFLARNTSTEKNAPSPAIWFYTGIIFLERQEALQSSSALNFASITNHIHDWPLFSLWFYLVILSGVISPLYSSSLLWNYWSGEFIFQCPIFFPFRTVHGILKAIILKWFAFPFPSWPCFVRLSTMTHPSWVALHGMTHSFFELDKAVVHVISLVSFLWFLFFSVCHLINKDKRFMEASWWERLTLEKLGGPISRVGP